MLAALFRFHGHGSLRYVYAKGRVIRGSQIIVKYSENKRRDNPRIAVVISKKILKSAVGRNRIRRRLYETVRHELPELKKQTDIVFIVVSSELLDMDHLQINERVRDVLQRADLYKQD